MADLLRLWYNGCLETYASATGIVRTAKEFLAEKDWQSELANIEQIGARDIYNAAVNGYILALRKYFNLQEKY